jgi:uncharacterized RDD family membrane protein YckC
MLKALVNIFVVVVMALASAVLMLALALGVNSVHNMLFAVGTIMALLVYIPFVAHERGPSSGKR